MGHFAAKWLGRPRISRPAIVFSTDISSMERNNSILAVVYAETWFSQVLPPHIFCSHLSGDDICRFAQKTAALEMGEERESACEFW